MGIVFKSAAGGSITVDAKDTANGNLITIPANSGMFTCATANTGAMNVPIGVTNQRSTNGVGLLRFNSQIGSLEFCDGTNWRPI